MNGQPKYVLKCQSQEELYVFYRHLYKFLFSNSFLKYILYFISRHNIAREARKVNVPSYIIRDAGRTQIPSGSETVLGIGPG